jgi:hypothetical protein
VLGCLDPLAFNFNDLDGDNFTDPLTGSNGVDINTDDGSCFSVVQGCMDPFAFNFNDIDGDNFSNDLTNILGQDVNTEDGSCYPVIEGCMDPLAVNYNDFDGDNLSNSLTNLLGQDVNTHVNICIYQGCTNNTAENWTVILTTFGFETYDGVNISNQTGQISLGSTVAYATIDDGSC